VFAEPARSTARAEHGKEGGPERDSAGTAMTDDPALLPAATLIKLYREGALSPVEATLAALKRIEQHNEALNAFCLVDGEAALEAALRSEERWRIKAPRGRLDGVPVSIKDLVLTRGWPTRRGSKAIDPEQPWDEDAPAVARLREHGAVLLGKTTTPEFGWKGVTDSPLTGITRNPWDPARTPGGSSGGAAAAVATGMGALAVGTDGGGSIRIPAGFTGIFGLKPSFGRVPAYPLSPFGTLSHLGPMTRTVEDAALMLTVLAEPDPRDWYALPADGTDYTNGLDGGVADLRIAFSPTLGGHRVDPEIAALVAAAARSFAELGAAVEEAEPELPDCAAAFRTHWYAGAANLLSGFTEDQKALMDPSLVEIAAEGAGYALLDYLAAVRTREAVGVAMNRFHQRYDLLLTPSLPIPAFEAGLEQPPDDDRGRWVDWTPFTYPFNLSRQPAASVPCGLTGVGLPAGLQIVGPLHADALVLRAARAYERTTSFPLPSL
jgi:aspartyl-tRNA(Asn)/glutamyl-tRNA(Gln) amidotransferase subunit A